MCTKKDLAGGKWCGKLHTRPAIDRLATPTGRTKYRGEGMCLGAWVQGTGRRGAFGAPERVAGQVWSQAAPYQSNNRGFWWIVAEDGSPYLVHDSQVITVGQAEGDVPLFDVAS